MRRRRTAILILATAAALAGSACGGPYEEVGFAEAQGSTTTLHLPSGVAGERPTTTTTPVLGNPIRPERIGVALDPEGRPYDATDVGPLEGAVEADPITTLLLPGGTVRVGPGEQVALGVLDDGDPEVSLVGDRAEVVLLRTPAGSVPGRVLGLRLDVPGAEVAAWQPFEPAYATDGGMGGVAGGSVRPGAGEPLVVVPEDDDVAAGDGDGRPGDDLVVFGNGFGDGTFPMSRGLDAEGRTVALLVWDTGFPWRLAVPDGTPPRDVVAREDQLAACLAGTRGLVDAGDGLLRCAPEP